jgi:hypothetical protein
VKPTSKPELISAFKLEVTNELLLDSVLPTVQLDQQCFNMEQLLLPMETLETGKLPLRPTMLSMK